MFIWVGCCIMADLRSGFNCWNFSCNFAICVRCRGKRESPCIVLSHFTVSCRILLKELDKSLERVLNVYIILMWKVYRGIGWCRHKLECSILMNQPFSDSVYQSNIQDVSKNALTDLFTWKWKKEKVYINIARKWVCLDFNLKITLNNTYLNCVILFFSFYYRAMW